MLTLKYAPRSLADIIGNDKVKTIAANLVNRGQPFAAWIDGNSGTGKTTLANVMASALCLPHNISEVNGQDCTLAYVRAIDSEWAYKPLGGGWRALIINEAHKLPDGAVQAFLTRLDAQAMKPRTMVIATTTEGREKTMFGNFDKPLLDRFIHLPMTSQGLAPLFAARLVEIAKLEGCDTVDYKRALRIVQDAENSMRGALQALDKILLETAIAA